VRTTNTNINMKPWNTSILIVTMSTINMSTCRPIHPENLIFIGTGMSGWFIVTLMCRTFITATATDKSLFSLEITHEPERS